MHSAVGHHLVVRSSGSEASFCSELAGSTATTANNYTSQCAELWVLHMILFQSNFIYTKIASFGDTRPITWMFLLSFTLQVHCNPWLMPQATNSTPSPELGPFYCWERFFKHPWCCVRHLLGPGRTPNMTLDHCAISHKLTLLLSFFTDYTIILLSDCDLTPKPRSLLKPL